MSYARICSAVLLILLSAEPAAAAPAGLPTPQLAETISARENPTTPAPEPARATPTQPSYAKATLAGMNSASGVIVHGEWFSK